MRGVISCPDLGILGIGISRYESERGEVDSEVSIRDEDAR